MMNVISYSNTRAKLKDVIDSAIYDKQEIVVTRKNGESIVIVSLEEWNSISETLHLLSSSNNAKRLHSAIAQLNANEGTEYELTQ